MMNREARFLRQMLVSGVGEKGQRAIEAGRVVVVGCGALGSVIASFLARAGVGTVVLVDPDRVETCNLHRQILFDEADARNGRKKVEAARSRLVGIHPGVRIEAIPEKFEETNAGDIVESANVVVDGTDNFATRYLMNGVCVKRGVPWVYGGVVGMTGMSMTVVRGRPCLRCIFPETPAMGTVRTPETDGVFGPVVGTIGSLEASEALKLLMGMEPARGLARIDLGDGSMARLDLGEPRDDCETCGK